jgi:hypothetical protein
MKLSLATFAIFAFTLPAVAQSTYVPGYTRNDGTYVQPHQRTTPDHNPHNNYSTQGNSNPYTGQAGTRSPESVQDSYRSNSYGSSGSNGYGTSTGRRY